MTDSDILRALAAELCEAKGPRFALDQAIARALGQDDSNPPPYTASLDAKLPSEDIAKVFAPGQGMRANLKPWRVVHKWTAGKPQIADAQTEPLARRAAALLTMAEKEEA